MRREYDPHARSDDSGDELHERRLLRRVQVRLRFLDDEDLAGVDFGSESLDDRGQLADHRGGLQQRQRPVGAAGPVGEPGETDRVADDLHAAREHFVLQAGGEVAQLFRRPRLAGGAGAGHPSEEVRDADGKRSSAVRSLQVGVGGAGEQVAHDGVQAAVHAAAVSRKIVRSNPNGGHGLVGDLRYEPPEHGTPCGVVVGAPLRRILSQFFTETLDGGALLD